MLSKPSSVKKTHSVNSWLNLIFSTLIVIFVFMCIVINLLKAPTELVQEVGLKTFRMFTVLSNMLVAIASAMTIPFAVDGIIKKNYHLPRWIVALTFTGVTCVTLTFLIALTVLSAHAGFVEMMLAGGNLYLHTLVPIMAIVSFLFVNAYHTVKLRTCFIAIIPVFFYAMTYLISVAVIGQENGGWRDHYHFLEIMPWYAALALILSLAFGISVILRLIHNYMHRRDKIATEQYYQTAEDYNLANIEDVIRKLANEHKAHDVGGEVIVPRRIIKFFENKYQSQKPLDYLCGIYLEEYLK